MAYKVLYAQKIPVIAYKIFTWYEKKRPGLGKLFYDELENAYTKLEQQPYNYAILYGNTRRIKLNSFPFIIIYRIKANIVTVANLKHVSQK